MQSYKPSRVQIYGDGYGSALRVKFNDNIILLLNVLSHKDWPFKYNLKQ